MKVKNHFVYTLVFCILFSGLFLGALYSLSWDFTGAVVFETVTVSDFTGVAIGGYNIGMFQQEHGTYLDTVSEDNSYFALRRQSNQVGIANQSLSFDLRNLFLNNSLKITGISGAVTYCNTREDNGNCDGSGGNKVAQGNPGNMNVLIQNSNGEFIAVANLTPTMTNSKITVYWSVNGTNYVNNSGFVNVRFEYSWSGNGKSAFLNDYSNISASYDIQPSVILSSPLNESEYLGEQEIEFECNATDDNGLKDITLYLGKNNEFNAIRTVETNGISSSARFGLNLGKGNYKWNCLVNDELNNGVFYSNNLTLNILGNLSVNNLGCNSTLVSSSEEGFMTGNMIVQIQENKNLKEKIKNFFKEIISFTGLTIFQDNIRVNCELEVLDKEGNLDINANISNPDGTITGMLVTNSSDAYLFSFADTEDNGTYNVMWKIKDDKKTLFLSDHFFINTYANSSNQTEDNGTINNQTTNPQSSSQVSNSGGGGGGGHSSNEESVTSEAKTSNTENKVAPVKTNNLKNAEQTTKETENKEQESTEIIEQSSEEPKNQPGFINLLGSSIKTLRDLTFSGVSIENIRSGFTYIKKSKSLFIGGIGLFLVLFAIFVLKRKNKNEHIRNILKQNKLIEKYLGTKK